MYAPTRLRISVSRRIKVYFLPFIFKNIGNSQLKITFAKLLKKPDMDDGPAYLAQILTHV